MPGRERVSSTPRLCPSFRATKNASNVIFGILIASLPVIHIFLLEKQGTSSHIHIPFPPPEISRSSRHSSSPSNRSLFILTTLSKRDIFEKYFILGLSQEALSSRYTVTLWRSYLSRQTVVCKVQLAVVVNPLRSIFWKTRTLQLLFLEATFENIRASAAILVRWRIV